MPAALEYLKPSKERESLGGKQERENRTRKYLSNKKYFEGQHPEWLIQEPDDPVNDNVQINVTKQTIDRTLSFLFPELPLFQLDVNTDTPEETWLNNTWLMNGGAFFLASLGQNGALAGHNYVRVIPNDTEFPRLVSLNPVVPITYWKVDDPDTVIWYELSWTVGKTERLQDVIKVGEIWEIHDYSRKLGTQGWKENGTFVNWDSPFPPIIAWPHLPNPNEYYGLPEVTENTKQLNDAINRIASDIAKILRYHAGPRTIATGVTEAEIIETEINGLFAIENSEAKVYNLEMQSDLSASMSFLNFLHKSFLALSRVVIMEGTVKDFQRVTNTGIKAVFLDMIAKNQLLRWTYGRGLQKICQTLMFVAKKTSSNVPQVTWADPLPADELETVNRLLIEQTAGWVDPKTISQSRGYQWKQVVSNWQDAVKYPWIAQGKQPARQGKSANSNSSLNNQPG